MAERERDIGGEERNMRVVERKRRGRGGAWSRIKVRENRWPLINRAQMAPRGQYSSNSALGP